MKLSVSNDHIYVTAKTKEKFPNVVFLENCGSTSRLLPSTKSFYFPKSNCSKVYSLNKQKVVTLREREKRERELVLTITATLLGETLFLTLRTFVTINLLNQWTGTIGRISLTCTTSMSFGSPFCILSCKIEPWHLKVRNANQIV